MELTDYVTNCMSRESAKDFLEMKGEDLRNFDPVLITAETTLGFLTSNDRGFNDLAEVARNGGCKYVVSVDQQIRYGGFFRKSDLYSSGTGLVPKQE